MSRTAVSIDTLLEHRTWVRALARSLVADPVHADDVEQEVWLRATRRPPADGRTARAWLATVVRNVVTDGFRRTGRRRKREERAARPEATASALDVVSQAEIHRRLVDAVLALPDTYRRAVLLRYFEGLPPREIAPRIGTSAETARKQVRRALALLREQLGGTSGGDATSWRAGFIAFADPERLPDIGRGVAIVSAKTKVAVGLFALIALFVTAGGLMVAQQDDPLIGSAEQVQGSAGAAGTETGAAQAARESGRKEDTRRRASGRSDRRRDTARGGSADPSTTSPESTAGITAAQPGRVFGRVVGPSGEAIRGARVSLRPSGSQDAPAQTVTTGPDGEFHVDGLAAGSYDVTVEAQGLPGTRVLARAGAERLSVALAAAQGITGRVVDGETGEPLEGVPVRLLPGGPGKRVWVQTTTDAAGAFSLSPLAEGKHDLEVGRRVGMQETLGATIPRTVEGVHTGVADLRIAVRRGGVISGTIVDELGEPVAQTYQISAVPRTRHGSLQWSRFRLVTISGGGPFRLTGLEEGPWDLTFTTRPAGEDEPKAVAEWAGSTVVEEVAVGTTDLVVRMTSAATIAGRLVNDADEAIGPGGWLIAVPAGAAQGGTGSVHFDVAADGKFETPALDAGRSYDLVAGGFEGHRGGRLSGVAPGSRDVRLVLPRAGRITGTIVGEDGKPVGGGVPVLAVAENVKADPQAGTHAFGYSRPGGTFAVEGLGDFATFIVVPGGGMSTYTAAAAVPGVKPGAKGLVLRVRPGAVLSGRLVDADGKGVKTSYLGVLGSTGGMSAFTVIDDDEGRFEIKGAAPGRVTLTARIGKKGIPLGEFDAPSKDLVLRLPGETAEK